MENRETNLKLTPVRSMLIGSSGLFKAVWIPFIVLLGVRLARTCGTVAAAVILGAGAVAAAAVIPLAYFIVKRTRGNFWGRYHFIFALDVLTVSLLCALLWGSGESDSLGAKTTAAAVCFPLFCVGMCSIHYISKAVSDRLTGEDVHTEKYRGVFDALSLIVGLAFCALPLTGLGEDGVGYVCGVSVLVLGLVFYFSTTSSLPRFVRPLAEKPTLKKTYREFFGRPSPKAGMSAAAFFFAAVGAVCALGYASDLARVQNFGPAVTVISCAAFAACAAAMFVMSGERSFSVAASAVGSALCTAVCIALTLVFRLASLSHEVGAVIVLCAFILLGAGFGLLLGSASVALRTYSGKKRSGIKYCSKMMLLVFAVGIGSALAAVLYGLPRGSDITFACIAGAAALTCTALVAAVYADKKRGRDKSID
ncbi:MAG: hypothetical protein HFE48_03015 [Clostridia bacterium]|nr:hypothetical protein [Clostridia bacterium]